MPSWKKVIVSGSNASLNSLTVATNVTAQSFTGSLQGTASWANNALTASYITASNVYGPYGSNSVLTSSLAISSSLTISSSYAATASFADRAVQLDVYVKNVTGTQINKGVVVRIIGATGDNPLIATASYTDDNNSANTLGITTQNIPNDSFGFVITNGVLVGIDTSTPGWTAGQLLYLGANGTITGSAPLAPLHAVRLGEVLRVQQINGSMFVSVDNGYELGELHNVLDLSTTSSYGDLLIRSGSVWTNSKQLTGSYGLTGSLTVTNGGFTGSLFGTASYALNTAATPAPAFPYTGSAIISGSLIVSGSMFVTGSPVQILSSLYMNPQTLLGDVSIPNNTNALILGPYTISGSISVGTNSNLLVIDNFDNFATTGSNTFTGNQVITGNTTTTGFTVLTAVSTSLNYVDDTTAAAGGVPLGGLYRSGSLIRIRLT